jgi:hypothetical protein
MASRKWSDLSPCTRRLLIAGAAAEAGGLQFQPPFGAAEEVSMSVSWAVQNRLIGVS